MVVAGARSAWAKRRRIELIELTGAAWTLPPLDSLYGSVVAGLFDNGLMFRLQPSLHLLRPRATLLATGRFVSIVQGR